MSVGNGRFTLVYPLWLVRWFIRRYAWSDKRHSFYRIGTRSIVQSPGLSCDPIALSYNTRFHCTPVEYRQTIYFFYFFYSCGNCSSGILLLLRSYNIIRQMIHIQWTLSPCYLNDSVFIKYIIGIRRNYIMYHIQNETINIAKNDCRKLKFLHISPIFANFGHAKKIRIYGTKLYKEKFTIDCWWNNREVVCKLKIWF